MMTGHLFLLTPQGFLFLSDQKLDGLFLPVFSKSATYQVKAGTNGHKKDRKQKRPAFPKGFFRFSYFRA